MDGGAHDGVDRISPILGAVSGVLATLAFMLVHDLWILDIWEMIGPMVFSGALTGAVLAWSYTEAIDGHTPAAWLAYNGAITVLLILLGIASFAFLEPQFTMAEAMAMGDEAIGRLLPPAIPLMMVATAVGTAALWAVFGRRPGALLPMLVALGLVVFFVGHQLAILGLVEGTGDLLGFYAEFVALGAFLAATYAVGVLLLARAAAVIAS